MSKNVDRLSLQRLIDGELDHAQRALILRELDCSPEQWRDVALALLEEQQLHRDIATVVCEAQSLDTIRIPKPTQGLAMSSPSTIQNNSSSGKSSSSLFWAMAASIMFVVGGFAAGSYLRGLNQLQDVANSSTGPQNTLASQQNSSSHLSSPSMVESGTLQLVSDGGTQPSLEVPVYEVSQIDERSVLGLDGRELRQLEKELRRRGMKLDVDTEILEGKLQDGRQIVVPVRNFQVRPYGQ